VTDSNRGEVTTLLHAWHAGDEDAYRRLSSILYDDLRRQAAQCMRRTRSGDTLQTTALVHETFVRLAGARQVDWHDRKHFLAVAARTMRRVLVDIARAQGSAKRGDRAVHVPLDSGVAAAGPPPRGSLPRRSEFRSALAPQDYPTRDCKIRLRRNVPDDRFPRFRAFYRSPLHSLADECPERSTHQRFSTPRQYKRAML